MKSETQIREELAEVENDLRLWRAKYDKVDLNKPDGTVRRMIVGNTISGVEGQIEALRWVLEEHE